MWEPGTKEQVYIQPFPGPSERLLVSSDGGMEPMWSPTGGEIFYRSVDGRQMLTVRIETTPAVHVGTPHVLFEERFVDWAGSFYANYDISRDGQRFLMIKADNAAAPQRLNVVVRAVK